MNLRLTVSEGARREKSRGRFTRQADVGEEERDEYNSMTCLSDNRLLVSDFSNNSVKLIDTTSGTVACSTPLSSLPLRICMYDDNTALVALPAEKLIQFIKIDGKTLKLGKTMDVSGNIRGITTCRENIVVSYVDPPGVEMLSRTGSLKVRIDNTTAGREVFMCPDYLTTSTDQQSIYVSDGETHMITRLDNRLHILQTFTHDLLRCPTGITAMSDDEILVATCVSNTIVSLQPSTGTCEKLLGEEDGIVEPKAIAYSPTQKTLYVSSWNGNSVHAYKHE